MSRALNRMTARKVASLKEPGRPANGAGLYLRVTPVGAKSWAFMTANAGKRTEIGLGAESSISLATARKLAADMREAVATGTDPRAVIAPKPAVVENRWPDWPSGTSNRSENLE